MLALNAAVHQPLADASARLSTVWCDGLFGILSFLHQSHANDLNASIIRAFFSGSMCRSGWW